MKWTCLFLFVWLFVVQIVHPHPLSQEENQGVDHYEDILKIRNEQESKLDDAVKDLLRVIRQLPQDFSLSGQQGVNIDQVDPVSGQDTSHQVRPARQQQLLTVPTETTAPVGWGGSNSADDQSGSPSNELGPGLAYGVPVTPSVGYGPPSSSVGILSNNAVAIEPRVSVLAQLVRFLLSLPGLKLAALQPLILGIGDASTRATYAAARATSHFAHGLPQITEAKADLLKNLAKAVGAKSEALLHVSAQALNAAGGAKTIVNRHLPQALDFAKDTTLRVASGAGHVVQTLADTKRTLGAAARDTKRRLGATVLDGARAKGKAVTEAIRSNHGIKSGGGHVGHVSHVVVEEVVKEENVIPPLPILPPSSPPTTFVQVNSPTGGYGWSSG